MKKIANNDPLHTILLEISCLFSFFLWWLQFVRYQTSDLRIALLWSCHFSRSSFTEDFRWKWGKRITIYPSISVLASVNPGGGSCPMALRLIACVLLLEITTFMRETYKSLPKMHRALFPAAAASTASATASGNTNQPQGHPPASSVYRASACWSSSLLGKQRHSSKYLSTCIIPKYIWYVFCCKEYNILYCMHVLAVYYWP